MVVLWWKSGGKVVEKWWISDPPPLCNYLSISMFESKMVDRAKILCLSGSLSMYMHRLNAFGLYEELLSAMSFLAVKDECYLKYFPMTGRLRRGMS